MAKRLGPSLAWWSEQPWAYTLYSYLRLQDDDRREQWYERMHRIEAAQLMAMAFHDPKRLDDERARAIADAHSVAPDADTDARARGLAMWAEMDRGRVLVS